MEIKTYRAATMHEALALVRKDLGPEAAVLHAREVQRGRLLGIFGRRPEIEVTASRSVNVPSRLPESGPAPEVAPALEGYRAAPQAADPYGHFAQPRTDPGPHYSQASVRSDESCGGASPLMPTPRERPSLSPDESQMANWRHYNDPAFAERVQGQLSDLQGMVRDLCQRNRSATNGPDLPDALFRLFTDLIEADVSEETARELIEYVREEATPTELEDPVLMKTRLLRRVEAEVPVAGAIEPTPDKCRVVALVGPTGVGKTTTIAKLAANYRLRHRQRVGLITVDTYRIAAVEQLRTYAEIIDLPMEVVSSPKEMRRAVGRLQEMDLILMDTAGRSPRDEIKIQELRSFLTEGCADDVLLVLSAVAATRTLLMTTERFAAAGTSGLILTKLDETTGPGNLLPLLRQSKLPLHYMTDGQNVPDDIQVAESGRLARLLLGMNELEN